MSIRFIFCKRFIFTVDCSCIWFCLILASEVNESERMSLCCSRPGQSLFLLQMSRDGICHLCCVFFFISPPHWLLFVDRFILPLAIGLVCFTICDPPNGGLSRYESLSISVRTALGVRDHVRVVLILFHSLNGHVPFPLCYSVVRR